MAFTVAKNAWCRNISKGLRFRTVNVSGNGPVSFAIDVYGRLWSWGRSDYGCAGQGNYNYDPALSGYARFTEFNKYQVVEPTLVALADGTIKEDWVKINVGEYSCMGIDKEGRLWGAGNGPGTTEGNCAQFGLPHDSGEDELEWKDGVDPRDNYKYNFFNFTRCAPDYTFKDFAHCYYYTIAIGQDDYLYFFGQDDSDGLTGNSTGSGPYPTFMHETPQLVANIGKKIKLLGTTGDFNYDGYAFVTTDNNVYGIGYVFAWDFDPDWATFDEDTDPMVFNLTGNLPDEDIVHLSFGYALFATLANGDVYGRGPDWVLSRDTDSYYEWVKMPLSRIKYCEESQGGVFAVDYDGRLWTFGHPDYGTGGTVADCRNVYNESVGQSTDRLWKSVAYNHYNWIWTGISNSGHLYAWGSQWWGPHLGIGTNYSSLLNEYGEIDEDPVKESCVPVRCNTPFKDSVDFHWPRPVPTPTPDYYER